MHCLTKLGLNLRMARYTTVLLNYWSEEVDLISITDRNLIRYRFYSNSLVNVYILPEIVDMETCSVTFIEGVSSSSRYL